MSAQFTPINSNPSNDSASVQANASQGEPAKKPFVATKQHLSELIRAQMVLAGDKLIYTDKSVVAADVAAIIRGIGKGHSLNVAFTFNPTPIPSSSSSVSSSAPTAPPIHVNHDNVKTPTALEAIIFEHYGVDTSKLGRRRPTWASFSVTRNGEGCGNFAELRQVLGDKRIAEDPVTLETMGYIPKGSKKRKVVDDAPVVDEPPPSSLTGRELAMQQRVEELERRLEATKGVAQDLYKTMSETTTVVGAEPVWDWLAEGLRERRRQMEERCDPEIWATIIVENEEGGS